jgi:hypothetical protein
MALPFLPQYNLPQGNTSDPPGSNNIINYLFINFIDQQETSEIASININLNYKLQVLYED